eukprot:CAMPEP_0174929502 /NCGR_PEP_ID=MMETSP1355-20121228/27332_1 /TAXON_ID=464990 /ORGANISM="Hemiselmis tepida, Strain CCMP443" /LENGTH=236 /DNA_ID=CAMNT_0016175713 /DNA_START=51 /DNA_END=757 /DNA_ORIENTATION=-
MPLARMMARSEAMQEHASSNPGLQSFLDKKSDEHVYSALYLLAGAFCLYAAFSHGDSFCTQAPPPGMKIVAHPQSLAWFNRFTNLVDNTTAVAAAEVTDVNASDITGEVGALMGDFEHQPFAGPGGFVVMWLKVEGFTALGLPLLSVVMLLLGLREHVAVGCLLFVVAVFQACWLALGCFWSFGGYVPAACVDGSMGDSFAFHTMWWVCGVWLGIMVLISSFMLCVVCCIMAVSQG